MADRKQLVRQHKEELEYTPEQQLEIAKCANDILYFAENYYYINNIDKGKIKIPLRDYQKKLLVAYAHPEKTGKRHCIMLSGRQIGKTIVTSVFFCWYILFNKDKTVGVISKSANDAQEVLRKFQLAFEQMPKWLTPGVKVFNKRSMEFDNGCVIITDSAAGQAARSNTFNLLYLDEFAFVRNTVADEFISAAFPTISSGKTSRIIMTSTPNGMNHFYDYWQKAVAGTINYFPIKVNWWEIPDRDEKWRDEQIEEIGMAKFLQEYACTFSGSSNALVDPLILETIIPKETQNLKYNGDMKVYEEPKENTMYVVGCDPARGIKRDYSTIVVLKIINERSFEQVAIYRSNTVQPQNFAKITVEICKYFGEAFLMIENNGQAGGEVASAIWHHIGYSRLISLDNKNIGIYSSKIIKNKACDALKYSIENGLLKIVDKDTIRELSKFELQGETYKAVDGNDDTVTSLMWANYIVKTDYAMYLPKSGEANPDEDPNQYVIEQNYITPFGFGDDVVGGWESYDSRPRYTSDNSENWFQW